MDLNKQLEENRLQTERIGDLEAELQVWIFILKVK